jgi:hypothetical protein
MADHVRSAKHGDRRAGVLVSAEEVRVVLGPDERDAPDVPFCAGPVAATVVVLAWRSTDEAPFLVRWFLDSEGVSRRDEDHVGIPVVVTAPRHGGVDILKVLGDTVD